MPKIFFEGKVYDNPEQMTPEAQARYEKAVKMLPDRDNNGLPDLLEVDGASVKLAESSPEPDVKKPPVSAADAQKAALAAKKTRKWVFWIIFSIVIGCVACFGIFLIGIDSLLKSSGAYQMALETAKNHPTAQQLLGTPIQDGLFIMGSVSESGSTGSADLQIPVNGPEQSGTLYVSAVKEEDTWRLTSLVLEVAGVQYPLAP